jgi:orotate phosphoribosyltransferase
LTTLTTLPEQIAKALLTIEAVALRPNQPFTWTSGIKAPIYCDNRLTISYPEIRELIADGFVSIIKSQYPDTDVIAGAATGGIPHAAWVAQKLNLPMIYVRDKPKGHGKENVIEGVLKANQKVVIIEDLISTGGSSLKVALAVNEAGCNAQAVLAIFTYQLARAIEAFAEAKVPVHTLSDYSTLLEIAVGLGKIRDEDIGIMQSWRANPQEFGK